MARFRKKPVVIDAIRWFKNGDHPADACELIEGTSDYFLSEGKVVRYFRRPDVPGERSCQHCGNAMNEHGWIDTLEGGRIVCPGDWVITGVKGERYPCKPDVFEATYEAVEEGTKRHLCVAEDGMFDSCEENEDGGFEVHINGGEYVARTNYCPFCGTPARVRGVTAKGEKA